jgi:uncharacterized protein YbjQ (UPF0145 family)
MVIKRCPKCGAGFKADILLCPGCGCGLIAGEDYAKAYIAQDAKPRPQPPDIPLFTFNPFGNGIETGAYKNLGLVSAYMALGVGPLTKVFSGWSNDFGVESKAYNEKMTAATDACILKMKTAAHEMGADTVIGVHTTFTELTAGHGQILVCMIGTAVKKAVDLEQRDH